jgi:16S rRNA (cytosine1402-N4)-methyltransferase
MYHNPVLLHESILGLNILPGGIYVDTTFGGGGHSRAMLEKMEDGKLFAFDQDKDAVANSPDDERFTLINQNFRYLKNFLRLHDIFEVDGILADLGVSSHQFDTGQRGFSTRFDAPLDMRMNQLQPLDASVVVNTYGARELTGLFRNYGELKNAFQISKAIVAARDNAPIKTTAQLCSIVEKNFPGHSKNKFLAMVFQALRIEVNDEMASLKEMLQQATDLLKPGGRLVVISYHSLEDRPVKNLIKTGNFEGKLEKDFYGNPIVPYKNITRKPIVPGEKEIEQNNRARSAKLRIAEKIG